MGAFGPVGKGRQLVAVLAAAICLPASAAEVTVSAAASLREAFTEIARAFEQANPAHRVLLNTGASGQLLQQIARGAPVDVLASADQDTMDKAEQQKLIQTGTRANFARNRLVVAIGIDSKVQPRTLADLRAADMARIAIGNPDSVPAGHYAKDALTAAGQWDALKPRLINTQNVRQALDYVARGEADAGFVYVTDALLMPSKVKVAFDVPTTEPVVYPIAVVKGGGAEQVGQLFVQYVQTEPARKILRKYGFEIP